VETAIDLESKRENVIPTSVAGVAALSGDGYRFGEQARETGLRALCPVGVVETAIDLESKRESAVGMKSSLCARRVETAIDLESKRETGTSVATLAATMRWRRLSI